jgi:hypothetical protein
MMNGKNVFVSSKKPKRSSKLPSSFFTRNVRSIQLNLFPGAFSIAHLQFLEKISMIPKSAKPSLRMFEL